MGEFFDAFVEVLDRKIDSIDDVLGKKSKGGEEIIASWFRRIWLPGNIEEKISNPVVAVDSSFISKEYVGGVSLIFAGAMSIRFNKEKSPKIQGKAFDIIPYPGPADRLSDLKTRIGEHLEHIVALESIKKSEEPGILLLDGSLVAREMAAAFNFRKYSLFCVQYALKLQSLFEEARKRGWTIISISKSSRASPVRDLALKDSFNLRLESLKESMEKGDLSALVGAWRAAKRNPAYGVELAQMLAEKYPQHSRELREIALLMRAKHVRRSDVKVIERRIEGPGRTKAVAIGPYTEDIRDMLRDLELNPEEEAKKAVSGEKARRMIYGEEYSELESLALDAVEAVLDLPVCVTVYARFRSNDEPMRIDFPGWEIGISLPWNGFFPQQLVDPEPGRVEEILEVVSSGYGGRNFHNVWLERVDREVKIREADVERIYEPFLWKRLGYVVPHARGERRVRRI